MEENIKAGLYLKLMKIQTELKAPKGQFNSFGKYKYRNAEDILEALKPLLKKNKCSIIISDTVKSIESGNLARFYVEATITLLDCETGATVESKALAREEEVKKGMDGSQITGTASSYARKYALNGMFAIDDTKDSDFTNDGTETEEEKKVRKLYAEGKKAGVTPSQIIQVIKNDYKKIRIEDLTNEEYNTVFGRLKAKVK
ncbi:MAG: ERF family protein [Clostridium sp.]|uniref:ERF family protein n=1 Tax=Clostridium sp. TaxID=1506 RepID=UPI003EE616F0